MSTWLVFKVYVATSVIIWFSGPGNLPWISCYSVTIWQLSFLIYILLFPFKLKEILLVIETVLLLLAWRRLFFYISQVFFRCLCLFSYFKTMFASRGIRRCQKRWRTSSDFAGRNSERRKRKPVRKEFISPPMTLWKINIYDFMFMFYY